MSSLMPSPSMPMARSLAPYHDGLPTMSAFELWKTQIESENQEAAVDAMKRLSCVAILTHQSSSATSPSAAAAAEPSASASNSNILSYLNTWVQTEQPADELLLLLGKELPSVLSVVKESSSNNNNGMADHNENTVSLLEKLASTEETVVRDQAVIVMNQLIESGEYDNNAFLALFKRLASADWFTARVSAAGLAGALLSAFTNDLPVKHDILNMYKDLSNTDQTPMVRRAAAKHLGSVLTHAGWPHRDACNWILQTLAATEQDSIRMLAIGALGAAGDSWKDHPVWTTQNWLPVLKDGATDLSWRVRNHIAKTFAAAAKTLGVQHSAAGGPDHNESTIIVVACFVAVLTDFEPEVRAAAVANLADMIAFAGPTIFATHLQPLLPTLADDVVMEVRSKCASALMDTAAANTLPDAVVVQVFGPLWESALHDDFPEVQLQVLDKLPKIAKLLPELPNTVAMILSMSRANNWRVRQAVAQLLPFLAQARDFATVLQAPTMALLLDPVAAVRNQIVSGTPLLVQTLGDETTYSVLWQSYLSIYESATSYLVRSTILGAWIAMAQSSQETNPDGELHLAAVGKITEALADPVPNVRRKAARGLGQMTMKLPQLQDLADNDADEDVRTMAAWALDQHDNDNDQQSQQQPEEGEEQ